MNRQFALVAAAILALAGPAAAQHPGGAPAAKPATTANLQGDGAQAWINDPHMHAFYELSVASLGHQARPDVDAYEQKSFAIFRDFAPKMHMTPEGMVDHLKLIPRQVVQIAKEDPHVLDSYDNFVAATFGPQ